MLYPDPMIYPGKHVTSAQSWANACDADSTLSQLWVEVTCLAPQYANPGCPGARPVSSIDPGEQGIV